MQTALKKKMKALIFRFEANRHLCGDIYHYIFGWRVSDNSETNAFVVKPVATFHNTYPYPLNTPNA